MKIESPTPAPQPSPGARAEHDSEPVLHFQEVLRSAAERRAAGPESPIELAARIRLRMLQHAIQLGEDEAGMDRFPVTALPSCKMPKCPPIPSQKFDSTTVLAAGQPLTPPTVDPLPPAVASMASPLGKIDAARYAPYSRNAGPATLPDIIARAASRYQVDPRVVKAVIRAESGYDPNAVSSAGAQGLMQLMPGTARDLGVTDPFDPEQNVMAGTRYLKQMLGRYGGNLEKALAAYNWGPGNLDRSDGRLPGETRRYIARIKDYLETAG